MSESAMKNKPRLLVLLLLIWVPVFLSGGRRSLAQGEASTPTATPTAVDRRFGAIESFWAPQEAAELGVGWERILFYWNEIQPTGPEDWNTLHVLEEWLVEAQAQDRIVLGLLKNTPAWATDGAPYSGLPRGLYLAIDDPDNLWANYVRRIVEYYGPRGVHNWIVWNEPEIEAGVYGHEFEGSVEDYVRMLEVTYLVAKEYDPQAVIHLAGYSYWHDPDYLKAFFETLTTVPEAAEQSYFFDVLSLHIYFRVETVSSLVRLADELQNSYGIDKPIWVNETNAAPNLDPWWPVERPVFQVDLDQQAWYIVQAYALGFAAGADSIGVYKLIDILLPEGGESFGILRPDYTQRPAYLSYLTTIRLLSGFVAPVEMWESDDYFVVTFYKGDQVVRVLWAREAAALDVSVPAFSDSGRLVDYVGRERPVRSRDGQFQVTLEGARCTAECEIGGPPLFLVEEAVNARQQPVSTPAAQSRMTLTPTAEVSPTFTPWPTNTATPTPTPTETPTPTFTSTPTATQTTTATQTPPMTASATPTANPAGAVALFNRPGATTDSNATGQAMIVEQDPTPSAMGLFNSLSLWAAAGVLALVLVVLWLRSRRTPS